MQSDNHRPETAGDLRRWLMNIALGVRDKEIDKTEAAIIGKLAKEINVSLYSEIKLVALLVEMGRVAPELGELRLFGPVTPALAQKTGPQ